jgi:hypothetical protein
VAKKKDSAKKLSNPFSTGGGGSHFEAHVQACFVSLMLTGGYAPCVPNWPIQQVKLQGKVDGFDTDDAIVYVTKPGEQETRKLVLQIKHSVGITQGDAVFAEVMQGAWSDFNNPKLFDAKKDVLALVTGPLSATDQRNVSWLLNQARHTKTVEEFLRNVQAVNFSPPKAGEKLNAFRHHLKAANGDRALTDQELYAFLNRYHLLGYDLGSEVGVVLSLLHSHISQFHRDYPQWAWSRIVDIVQTWNQDAGTVSLDRLPEDLKDVFQRAPVVRMPPSLAIEEAPETPIDWAASEYAEELALVSLVGGWDESKPADIAVIEALSGHPYAEWVKGIRAVLQLRGTPLKLKNGVWEVNDRTDLWEVLGPRVFDQLLDGFCTQAVAVLRQADQIFDVPVEERSTAIFSGRGLSNSGTLRSGLADGLALLGSRPQFLTNCSTGKAETVAVLSVRQVLKDAPANAWGSVQDVLPTLAESAPDEFLRCTEEAAQATPSPFDQLFSQEGDGVDGRNYMVGLLWALEALAWEEQFIVRSCSVLADLASHDPGGRWSNRPSNSLTTILLPWLPQTRASIEKRKVAVEVVCEEQPDVGWGLLLSSLPDQQRTTSGTYRPKWRNPVVDMNERQPTRGEYREQVLAYSAMAVTMAGSASKRLGDLVERFAELPLPSGEALLQTYPLKQFHNCQRTRRPICGTAYLILFFITRNIQVLSG